MNGGFDNSNGNGQTKTVAGGRYKLTLKPNNELVLEDTGSGQTLELAPNQANTKQIFEQANQKKVKSLFNGPAGGGMSI